MTVSARERALGGLYTCLRTLTHVEVEREDTEVGRIPPSGLIVVRDGDPGEPDILLSPRLYEWAHTAEVVVQFQAADARARERGLDERLQEIDRALKNDPTLGGAVEWLDIGHIDFMDEPVEGGIPIKAALLSVVLHYVSTTPLGPGV